MIRLTALALVALLTGCASTGELITPEIPCHTDLECHQWAVEQGLPESEWP